MIDKLGSPETYNHYPTGLGGGLLARRTGCSSATRNTPAALPTQWSSTGRRASRPRAKCGTSTTTAPTSCRPSSNAAASRCRTS